MSILSIVLGSHLVHIGQPRHSVFVAPLRVKQWQVRSTGLLISIGSALVCRSLGGVFDPQPKTPATLGR